jgi:TonB-dependent starch-binding outer membrane protein SusC
MKGSKLTNRGKETSFMNCTLPIKLTILISFLTIMQVTVSAYSGSAQQLTVTGKITDRNTGELLAGVNVIVEGTLIGTISDASGKYTIQASSRDAVLVFSSIGYISEKASVNGQSVIDVSLISDVKALEEVVVVGYGIQKKKDITGAISVVETKTLKSIPTGNPATALQGLASGLTILNSGVPGGRTDVFIRGVTSLGNSSPLVIVDGVPGSMENLNVNDIESMQVLKDAGAASIYGVRASNGVILITTRKGKAGKPTITYEGYYGVEYPKKGNVYDLLNSEDYAKITKFVNPGTILFANGLPDYMYTNRSTGVSGTAMEGDPVVDPALYNLDMNNWRNNYLIQKVNKVGTDWFQELNSPAPRQSHIITASGGGENSNFLFSVGYLNQQGTVMETYLKRYSVRLNSSYNVGKHIRFGENLYAYYRLSPGFSNSLEGNPLSNCFRMMPVIPVYDIMGNFGGTGVGPEGGTTPQPVASQIRTEDNRSHNWNTSGNLFAEVDFLKNFTARTSFGGNVGYNYGFTLGLIGYNDREGFDGYNTYSVSSSYSAAYTWTNTLTYAKILGKQNIKVLIGSEAIKGTGRNLSGSAGTFFSMDPNYLVLGNGTTNITNGSGMSANAIFSLFSRLDYSYADKYLLGATVRRDGSSVFGADKRYGVFPSFSLGWRLSGEEFMKSFTFLNDLKLRGSYGVLGSQANINPSNAFTLFGSGFGTSYYLMSGTGNTTTQGFNASQNGNPNTGWEENVNTNLGVDVAILDSRLMFSGEWYKKSINGLLFPQPLPATAGGAAAPTVNIGDIQNTGWDFSLTYRGGLKGDFDYNVTGTLSTYKNEVVKIPGGYFDIKSSRIGNLVRIQEGQPVGTFFGYEILGIFKDDAEVAASPTQTAAAPGRFKYRDVNGDGTITSDDRTFYGNPNPVFTYGLNLGATYKDFDLSAVFYGSYGNDNMNFVRYYTDFMSTSEGKGRSNVLLNAWTPTNTNTTVPILEFAPNFSTNSVPNSYYLENGSFFKCRSVVFGYNLKPASLERFGISKFRAYIQGANLFTITKYTGLDPELNGTLTGTNASTSFGIDLGNYPGNQIEWIMGINITF